MATKKKKPAGAATAQQLPGSPIRETFNAKFIFGKYNRIALPILFIVLSVFCFSVFKNIRYPLFWADESITAVGGQRVLQFGYPKVHDGKNVFYDLRHSNVKLGIDKKTDAYVGGTGWLHYYIAAIAIRIASVSDDMYTQTGIIRTVFAIIGISGILVFVFFLSRFLQERFTKVVFASLLLAACLFSVSLNLLLREVRYYSPTIFLVSFIAGYYVVARFLTANRYLFAVITCLSLLLLFQTFPPVYFIVIIALSISETVIIFLEWLEKDDLKRVLLNNALFVLPVIISLLGVVAVLPYFRTFAIAREMAVFNANNSGSFSDNIKTVFTYFWKFELLWLAIPVKVLVLLKSRILVKRKDPKFKASLFLSLLFLVYCIAITRIPNFIYTRYFSPNIVILDAIILLDLFCLNGLYPAKNPSALQLKTIAFSAGTIIILAAFFFQNNEELSGHIKELAQPYKGPLDYTIPYIKQKYKQTDNLVIATNYEESSFMYYLNSKTIVGFVGNNLENDTLLTPDIISIRKVWSFNQEPLKAFLNKAHYTRVTFPVHDNAVNNIPELNFTEEFNHRFETEANETDQDATDLYIRTKE